MLDYGVPGQQALTPRFSLIQSAQGHLRGSGLAGKRWRDENQRQNEARDLEDIAAIETLLTAAFPGRLSADRFARFRTLNPRPERQTRRSRSGIWDHAEDQT
jgi:hypothetical protein